MFKIQWVVSKGGAACYPKPGFFFGRDRTWICLVSSWSTLGLVCIGKPNVYKQSRIPRNGLIMSHTSSAKQMQRAQESAVPGPID